MTLISQYISVPDQMAIPAGSRSRDQFIQEIFGEGRWDDVDWLMERAIVTPLLDGVDEINAQVLPMFPGEEEPRLYASADSTEGDHSRNGGYPVKFPNRLCPSGMPPMSCV